MGARGNSGVILSQFFRGVYVGMQNLDHNELTVSDLMNCLESGCRVAYKAVMEPVEGTILTVVREAAENTKTHLSELKTINELLDFYLAEAKKSLDNTPNLLPVLKEAGVVDSGGAGFLEIIEGMIMALNGQMLEATEDSAKQTSAAGNLDVEIKFGYCTEFILDLKDPQGFDEKALKSVLSMMGDSLVVVKDENICKVHVHTNFPGRALDAAQKYGEFITLKIENMRLQHSNLKEGAKEPTSEEPKKKIAIIAVCFGDGISQTFKDLGVDYVIEGGQTMNPSTEAFVDACKQIHAENIIIIPNNGNVVMAAAQAAKLVNDAKVEVLKAKTISQGYASLMCFDPEGSLESNLEAMSEAVDHVKTGEITYSIRDTEIGGVKINSGDFMAIANGDIIASKESQDEALKTLLKGLVDEESQIITFFCGNDATEDEMNLLEDMCKDINSEVEVEIIEGRQDIYSYIIAVE